MLHLPLTLFLTPLAPLSVETVQETLSIPMPDGITLVAELHRPADAGALPTVLLLTPYGTFQHTAEGRRYAEAGFSAIFVNQRGKFGSGGDYLPFIDEVSDSLATLEWILERPFCDGRIGLVGASSQSYSAQILAATGHPALRTLINVSGLTDIEELFFPGGAFRLDTMYPWLLVNYSSLPRLTEAQWAERFRQRPIEAGFTWDRDLLEGFLEGSVDVTGIGVPVLHLTGWNDVVYRQTLHLHSQLERQGVFQKLVIGPWLHNETGVSNAQAGDETYADSALQPDYDAFIVEWMDRFLRGNGNGIDEESPVRIYVMGANEWMEADSFPPENTSEKRLYLTPGPGEEPGLGSEPGSQTEWSFRFDPSDPVPTRGGVTSHLFPKTAGPRDQASLSERTDVLVFRTEPLEEELRLVGPLHVVLQAKTDAEDADFTAKLVIERPDGYQRIVEDGIVRGRHRHSLFDADFPAPNTFERYDIDLGWTAIALAPGERITLHISSSNFPKYDLNPGTRANPLVAERFESARQTINSEGSYLALTCLDE